MTSSLPPFLTVNTYNPLFVTGPARSGSTLLARMLSAHSEAMVASDPYFPLFRSFRNAVLRENSCDDAAPLQDYYFTDERIRMMDIIQSASLDARFDETLLESLVESIEARALVESSDLAPSLKQLGGDTYRELFENGLDIIARTRSAAHRQWVGFKDVWILEFFPALARAFPHARFVVLLRDPRAMVWSMIALSEKDPAQFAHTLSYARHWRKYIALLSKYNSDPAFSGRLMALRYEDLIGSSEGAARNLCDFLGLDYDESMLDSSNYVDYATGLPWKTNSSFPSNSGSRNWRDSMDRSIINLVDLACGPDMRLYGYEPVDDSMETWFDAGILRYLIEIDRNPGSWRSDFQDPGRDYSLELLRRALLLWKSSPDANLVRQCFLFEEAFATLKCDRVNA